VSMAQRLVKGCFVCNALKTIIAKLPFTSVHRNGCAAESFGPPTTAWARNINQHNEVETKWFEFCHKLGILAVRDKEGHSTLREMNMFEERFHQILTVEIPRRETGQRPAESEIIVCLDFHGYTNDVAPIAHDSRRSITDAHSWSSALDSSSKCRMNEAVRACSKASPSSRLFRRHMFWGRAASMLWFWRTDLLRASPIVYCKELSVPVSRLSWTNLPQLAEARVRREAWRRWRAYLILNRGAQLLKCVSSGTCFARPQRQ
jgi:hypothetical protein